MSRTAEVVDLVNNKVGFKLVRGSLPLVGKVLLVPVRALEVASRMGSAVTLFIAIRITFDDVLQAHCVMSATVATFAAIDAAIFLWAGPVGTWRRVAQNLLAMAGPLRFPAALRAAGPFAVVFYAVRAMQVSGMDTTPFSKTWFSENDLGPKPGGLRPVNWRPRRPLENRKRTIH